MKTIYFASPKIALESLQALHNDPEIEIELVITQADKKAGRGKKQSETPIKKLAKELNLEVFEAKKSKDIYERIKKLKIDLNIVFAFGMILKKEVLNHAKKGSINIHASILPKYRGASPINESILNSDEKTGITIIKMDEEMDHGDIIKIIEIPIYKDETTASLSEKISKTSANNICKIAKEYIQESLKPTPQNHKLATFCKKILPSDAEIKITDDTSIAFQKIKAFDENPKAYLIFKDKKIILHKAEETENKQMQKGLQIINKELILGLKDGSIKILELTLEGKKRMDYKSFLNGYKNLFE